MTNNCCNEEGPTTAATRVTTADPDADAVATIGHTTAAPGWIATDSYELCSITTPTAASSMAAVSKDSRFRQQYSVTDDSSLTRPKAPRVKVWRSDLPTRSVE